MEINSNVLLFLENRTDELQNKISLGIKSHLGWQELTFRGLAVLSKRLAGYLIDLGINKGDKIAILSESMPEWGATLFASVLAGATTIPLDIKLTTYELTSILSDCEPKILFSSSALLETALKLKETIPSIEHIILIDGNTISKEYASLYNIEDRPDRKLRHRSPGKTAFIIYTSGTTGKPKGVEITFKNVMAQVEAIGKCFHLSTKDQLLSILPMNHLFELTVGFLSFLNMGTSIYYSQSLKPKDLFNVITTKEITFMVVVPAFLKLLKGSIENEIAQSAPFQRFMFKVFFNIAKYIPFGARKILFRKIHKKFGGKFKGCISGGAPLDIDVGRFFQTIGIQIYEGYGLSEASPVVSVNIDGANKLGSVGKAIPGVVAKIDEKTGELLVKGDNVMKGYYNRRDLTDQVIDADGWLHTGDIAHIDNEGFIFITGRIKSMIVLPGGKKVFPEELEAVLEKSPKFEEICVFGANKKSGQKEGAEEVCLVVVPKEEILQNNSDEQVEKIVKEEVKEISKKLSSYKRPNNIIISKELLPRTATKKIQKNKVREKFFS